LANETIDVIALFISGASASVAIAALIDARRARNKAFEAQKQVWLTDDQRKFLQQLHAVELVQNRQEVYHRFCSKKDDEEALREDREYREAAGIVSDLYGSIAFELETHPDFADLSGVGKGDWTAIIKCNKAFLPEYNDESIEKLVNIAKEQLTRRNVNIDDIDPCKQRKKGLFR
jgi:hypothetical protein